MKTLFCNHSATLRFFSLSALAFLCVSPLAAGSQPIMGSLSGYSEKVYYTYVGETAPGSLAPMIGEGCMERQQFFREIRYSGNYIYQKLYWLEFTYLAYEVSGSRIYNDTSAVPIQEPEIQYYQAGAFHLSGQ